MGLFHMKSYAVSKLRTGVTISNKKDANKTMQAIFEDYGLVVMFRSFGIGGHPFEQCCTIYKCKYMHYQDIFHGESDELYLIFFLILSRALSNLENFNWDKSNSEFET